MMLSTIVVATLAACVSGQAGGQGGPGGAGGQPGPGGQGGAGAPATGPAPKKGLFKSDTPCDGRDWTYRLTGPFAPHEMEIRPAVDLTQYKPEDIDPDNMIVFIDYPLIKNGDLLCTSGIQAAQGKTLHVGGQVFMHDGQKCLPLPTKTDGSSCCKLFFWHPDGEGYYRSVCSATMDLEKDGLWHFETVVPGNECPVHWGGDCSEHVHYALQCDMCDSSPANQAAYGELLDFEASPQYFSPNKYYLYSVSKEEPGAAPMHVATKVTSPDGKDAFKYAMVWGIYTRDKPGFELAGGDGEDGDGGDDGDDDDE